MLEGYKTYIVCLLVIVIVVLKHFNWIDSDLFTQLVTVLLSTAGITLAAKINRGQTK